MKRTNSDLLVFAAILLPAVLFCAAGWLAIPAPDRSALSGWLAGLILVADGLLLFLTSDRVTNETSQLVPVIYIVLAAANPAALSLTPLHAASLLLAVSMLFYLLFSAVRPSLGYLAIAWATLGCAALFYPPLAWLAPVYAATTAPSAEEKGKSAVTLILSFILPAGIWIGIQYLRGAGLPGDVLRELWAGMTTVQRPALHFSAATLCRILLTVLATVLAAIHILRRLTRYRTAQYRAFLRLLVLTLALAVLNLVFLADSRQPLGLLSLLPAALLLNEYFRDRDTEKGAGLLAVILAIILIFDRISCFV